MVARKYLADLTAGDTLQQSSEASFLFHYNRAVRSRGIVLMLLLLLETSCSGLTTLTPEMLEAAEMKWNASKPASYRLVVTMEGDRVERGEFEVQVLEGKVTSLKRNGEVVKPTEVQDYSMDGMFKIIHDEMDLAKNPSLLGASEGYSAYLMARFDSRTGRLEHYRRAVGGISNSIDIRILRFEPEAKSGK
jgi:hypothetical protein